MQVLLIKGYETCPGSRILESFTWSVKGFCLDKGLHPSYGEIKIGPSFG